MHATNEHRFENFFGLRDFIHFINYIRRNRQGSVNASLVLQSLERNFNGSEDFKHICSIFLDQVWHYLVINMAALHSKNFPCKSYFVECVCNACLFIYSLHVIT